jgi:spermidine synthase
MVETHSQWFAESINPDLIQLSSIKATYYSGRSNYQKVEVLELGGFGRCLVLDGKTQSTESDEFMYHEALVHPALMAHPNPKKVFIAGGGEGATLRETLRHVLVDSVTMVDIDKEVVDLCKQYLPKHHQNSFNNPKTTLIHQDAKQFLQDTADTYDVAILDLPDPLEGGPAATLYTQTFLSLVKSRLSENGLFVMQSGACGPTNYHEVFPAIHNTVETLFPITECYQVYVPSFAGPWSFVIGSKTHSAIQLQENYLKEEILRRKIEGLRMYDETSHSGLFALPKYLNEAINAEDRIITESTPIYII